MVNPPFLKSLNSILRRTDRKPSMRVLIIEISAFTYQFLSDVVGHWLVNSELTIIVDY